MRAVVRRNPPISEAMIQHRRDVRREMILPLVIAAVLLVILPAVAVLLLMSTRQLDIVASFAAVMVALFFIIVGVIPYTLLLVPIFGMNRLYRRTESLLASGQRVIHRVNGGLTVVSKGISRPFIAVQRRFAWVGRVAQLPRPRS